MSGAHSEIFEFLKYNSGKHYPITVTPSQVNEGDIEEVKEIILSAGESGERASELMYRLDIRFVGSESIEKELSAENWVSDRDYEMWFEKLGKEIPYALFFLSQWNHRLYIVAGDLMRKGKGQVNIEGKKLDFIFDENDARVIDDRVIEICKKFAVFCGQKNINPEEYIKKALDDFMIDISYDKVIEKQ